MKRLLILIIVGATAWYGWHHYHDLLRRVPRHEAVILNQSGETVTRIRLTVAGQTFVRDELKPGESATFSFGVNDDSRFSLVWEYAANTLDGRWTGGQVSKGPLVMRHTLTIKPERGLVYEANPL
jgi:hypothetical protein